MYENIIEKYMLDNFIVSILRKLNISARLTVGFVSVFITLLLLFSYTSYNNTYKLIDDKINDELRKYTVLISKNIEATAETTIKNYLRASTEFVYQYIQEQYDLYKAGKISVAEAKQNVYRLLHDKKIGEEGYYYILDSNGVLVHHSDENIVGKSIYEYDFVKSQIEIKNGYIEYNWQNEGELEPRRKSLHMLYFEPWDWIVSTSSYKDDAAYLINVDDFANVISSIKFGETGYTYILDDKANFIYHPFLSGDANEHSKTRSSNDSVFKEIIKGEKGIISYQWMNPEENELREKLAIYDYIDKFKWNIVSSTYPEELYAPLHKLKNSFWAISILSIFAIIPMVLFFSHTIVSPLKKVISHISDPERQKYNISVDSDHYASDEIAVLANSFNDLMKRVETSTVNLNNEVRKRMKSQQEQIEINRRLDALNISLEKKVRAQKKELEQSANAMKQIQDQSIKSERAVVSGSVTSKANTSMEMAVTAAAMNKVAINALIEKYKNNELTDEELEQSLNNISDTNNMLISELEGDDKL